MAFPWPGAFFLLLFLSLRLQLSAASSSEELLLSPDHDDLDRSHFPEGFVFGASTSAYQVEGAVTEGGRGVSIWDTWAHAGNADDGSVPDVTADQYHRYEEDIDLIAGMNMDAYRFSISWTRILPDGFGPEPNPEGIAYYNRLINRLLVKGITPYVTLYHWDLPQTLQDAFGGWIDRQIVEPFVVFAETCFAAFGDRVKHWMTVNEPQLNTLCSYGDATCPPGRSSHAETEAYIVGHNYLLAHGAAVDVYRKKFQSEQQGEIGFTVDCMFAIPMTNSSEDIEAAQRRNEFQLGWFLDPIYFGDYPAVMRQNVGSRLPKFSAEEVALLRGSMDFIGINHYTSRWVTPGPGPILPNSTNTLASDQRVTTATARGDIKIGPRAASWWLYIVPEGLYGVIKWTADRYNAPIYITENGMDYDEDLPFEDSLRDLRRVEFFKQYLSSALRAVREGIDVRGYFAWSLLDNWEWASGYTKRFGLVYVDYKDGSKRYRKDSSWWFQSFLRRFKSDSEL